MRLPVARCGDFDDKLYGLALSFSPSGEFRAECMQHSQPQGAPNLTRVACQPTTDDVEDLLNFLVEMQHRGLPKLEDNCSKFHLLRSAPWTEKPFSLMLTLITSLKVSSRITVIFP